MVGPAGYAIAAPVETEVGTEKVVTTAKGANQLAGTVKDSYTANLLLDSNGKYIAETSLAVVDQPIALKIAKVHAKTQKPLQGAAFQLKSEAALTTAIKFTKRDGGYWYDTSGSVTTIEPDANAVAMVYGLPAGKYELEETVVPEGFFPAVPQSVDITVNDTAAKPKEVTVVNTPTVKLGIDSDRFNVVIAMGLTVMVCGGLGGYYFMRKKKII